MKSLVDIAVDAPVSAIMSWPVATVEGDATLREVAEALSDNEVSAALVLIDGHFAGVVSERDVAVHLADGANPEHLLAEEMASGSVVAVDPQDSVRTAGERMMEAGIRHLPVIGERGIEGMVSIRDVCAVLLR